MSDLPLHRTMQDDEIDRLKAQLRETEEKGRVLMDMCRDLKARVAEYETLTDSMDAATRHCYLSGPAVVRQFKRLRQQPPKEGE